MEKKSAIELANSVSGKISEEYDLTIEEMCELRVASKDLFHAVINGYNFGYLRGIKAEKAKKNK